MDLQVQCHALRGMQTLRWLLPQSMQARFDLKSQLMHRLRHLLLSYPSPPLPLPAMMLMIL
tara:strand:+ start:635 stop:817 length:183 start_codon:yes stop_codon:yes gene_type:complete